MKQSPSESLRAWGWFLTATFVFMSCWMVLFRQTETAVAFSVIDDAMYYPKLALNIVSKGMMTYDGVTTTNGFHPLWLIFLIPVYLVTTDPFLALKLTFIYVFALLLICCILLTRICQRLKMSVDGLFVAFFIILLNLRSFTVFFSLMESHLVLLCYLLYLTYSFETADRRYAKSGYAFLNGLLLGACFLARIDSFLLAASYGFVLTIRFFAGKLSSREFAVSSVSSFLGCAVLVGPYLLSNVLLFGRLSPVSAYMKASTSYLDDPEIVVRRIYFEPIPRLPYVFRLDFVPAYVFAAFFTLALLFLTFLFLLKIRRERLLEDFFPISDFMLFALVHFIFICLAAPVEAVGSPWYVIPEILALGLLLGACTPSVTILRVRMVPLVIGGLLVGQVLYYPSFVGLKKMTFAKIEVADYIRNHLPENIRGGMIDSGIVSYFAQRDFVGLNGLIGDFEMARLVNEKKLTELAEKYGINIFVLDTPENLLPELRDNVVFESSIRSKFVDFREPEKPFVVFKVTSHDLERIWDLRYGKGYMP